MQRATAEVHDGIWQSTRDYGPVRAWSYLVDTAGDGLVLFDIEGVAEPAELDHFLETMGRDAAELKIIVLSHSHHLNSDELRAFVGRNGRRILAARKGRELLDEAQKPEAPAAGLAAVADHIDWLEYFPFKLPYPRDMQILHSPGHSPDGISLFLRAENILICGEAFVGPGPAGYLPVYSDVPAYRKTLRRMAELAPTRLLTGRYGVLEGEIVPAAVDQALRMVQHIEEFISEAIRKIDHGVTIDELMLMLSARFSRKVPAGFHETVRAHLQVLHRSGQARLRGERWLCGGG